MQKSLKLEIPISLTRFKNRAAHRSLHLYIVHLYTAQLSTSFPYCIYLFCSFCTTVSLLAHPSFAHPTIPVFNCHIVITSPPWPMYCLNSLIWPNLHSLYIDFFFLFFPTVLLTVCFVHSMCNSVLLYVSNCYALSWSGYSCKWERVLN